MKLQQRKEQILSAIIENYIATGEAVGSKTLQNGAFNDISSATIRNDMAELAANGLLIQQHTSAGRIPSNIGYKYYVENLMQKTVSLRVKSYIDEKMSEHASSPEKILKTAKELLLQFTEYISVCTTPPAEDIRINNIKIIQTSKHIGMMVLVTSVGMIKTKVFRSEYVLTPEIINVFEKALREKLSGVKVNDISTGFIQSVAASFGELSLIMPEVLHCVKEAAEESDRVSIEIAGAENILHMPDIDFYNARNLFLFINDKEYLTALLHKNKNGVHIYFGNDEEMPNLYGTALVSARYRINGNPAGALAVLGPNRMNYSAVLGTLEYIANVTGELIQEAIAF